MYCAALSQSCAPAQVALVSHTQSPLSFGLALEFEFSQHAHVLDILETSPQNPELHSLSQYVLGQMHTLFL